MSMVEAIDAMEAVKLVDIGDRSALKAALGATLVKNARHYEAFDVAFEVFFAHHRETDRPGSGPSQATGGDGGQSNGRSGSQSEIDELVEALFRAIMGGDPGALGAAARRAVEELAGIEPGRPVGGTYYLYRTLRRLDLDALQERLLEAALAGLDEDDALDTRLAREEVDAQIARLRQEIQDEIRRRLVADRGRKSVARTLRQPLVEDLDLMHATRSDLTDIEDVIEPLTRKLAARLARRRRLLQRLAGSTFERRFDDPWPRVVFRWIRLFEKPGPIDPRSSCCATSRGRWPPSPASLSSSPMRWRPSSRS